MPRHGTPSNRCPRHPSAFLRRPSSEVVMTELGAVTPTGWRRGVARRGEEHARGGARGSVRGPGGGARRMMNSRCSASCRGDLSHTCRGCRPTRAAANMSLSAAGWPQCITRRTAGAQPRPSLWAAQHSRAPQRYLISPHSPITSQALSSTE